eukprot:Lithocolla_globosa_v1_NODE_2027_length_2202_cov_15.826735.p1 type:complete len:686 gc:universal NODE_2027_length_2202_cov_15.826735:2127-70(-)
MSRRRPIPELPRPDAQQIFAQGPNNSAPQKKLPPPKPQKPAGLAEAAKPVKPPKPAHLVRSPSAPFVPPVKPAPSPSVPPSESLPPAPSSSLPPPPHQQQHYQQPQQHYQPQQVQQQPQYQTLPPPQQQPNSLPPPQQQPPQQQQLYQTTVPATQKKQTTPIPVVNTPEPEPEPEPEVVNNTEPRYVKSIWASPPKTQDDDLIFAAGSFIYVLDDRAGDSTAWWYGQIGETIGYFPGNYVSELDATGQEEDDDVDDVDVNVASSLTSADKLELVVKELVQTEKDYFNSLSVIIDGYKKKMEVLDWVQGSAETISTIFGNIEEVYEFERNFVKKLDEAIFPPTPSSISVQRRTGKVFLQFKDGFRVYGPYCSNHADSTQLLLSISKQDKFKQFFLACRLLIEQDINLEGFLLTPIQRLCKYPLLLREVIKLTPEDHADIDILQQAISQMKEAASFVNEMQKLKELQTRIEDWEGTEELSSINTKQYLDAKLMKLSKGHLQERHFFLFDKTLVYTKEHPSKKRHYIFKGCIYLNQMEIKTLGNEGEEDNNLSFEIVRFDLGAPKTYVVSCSSVSEKEKWVETIHEIQEKLKTQQPPPSRPKAPPPAANPRASSSGAPAPSPRGGGGKKTMFGRKKSSVNMVQEDSVSSQDSQDASSALSGPPAPMLNNLMKEMATRRRPSDAVELPF